MGDSDMVDIRALFEPFPSFGCKSYCSLSTVRIQEKAPIQIGPTPKPIRINNAAAQAVKPRKARILVLHGHAQSGPYMEIKTNSLTSMLVKSFPTFSGPGLDAYFPGGFEFFYPTAPHRLNPSNPCREAYDSSDDEDLNAWCWGIGDYATDKIERFDASIRYLLRFMKKEGPFTGIIGFSTGATTALTLMSLAERGASSEIMKTLHLDPAFLPSQPFQFGIFYSGCILSHPLYRSLFYPKINTPVLHFIGKYDTYLPEPELLKFSGRCRNISTEYHSGAHFVPRYKECQKAVHEFMKEKLKYVTRF